MKFQGNTSIKSRMILTFLALTALFIIFSIISIREMKDLSDLTYKLYDHPLRVSNAALRASMGVIKMHDDMHDMLLSKNQLELQDKIQAVQSEEEIVYQNLDIVRRKILGAEGKKLERETRELFAEWKPIRYEEIGLVMEGNRDAATLITRGKGADYVAHLEDKMLELTSYARNKADNFMMSSRETRNQVFKKTIALVIVVILLTFIIFYLMTTGILSDLSRLKNAMAEIVSTGSLVEAELAGIKEIRDITEHFNSLIDRLKDQFWLRDGESGLNRELSDNIPYDELVTKSINFVSRYVGACAGALYTYDKDNNVCELRSSFAFVERKYLSNRFKPGEGIVGQVAVEKKPILLKGIAREEAVVNTGTISEPPRYIYAVPLLYEEELYGVLEVASFEDIDDIKRALLDAAARTVCISLHTASQNRRIRQFLESTQKTNLELRAKTEELELQAEELKLQASELEAQRIQVEEADRLKSEFLSNMSHELRTPLNSILTLTQLMISRGTGKEPEQEMEFMRVIDRSGRQLLSLINDILNLSKIESGQMDLNLTDFDPREAVDAVLETIHPMAEEKGLRTNIQTGDGLMIHSDREKIQQILLNLLSNAVKFTEQGEIGMRVWESEGKINFEVRDTGIGIKETDLKDIFDKFRQINGTTTRKYEGTGLGLAIARELAGMLQGEISVKSVEGEGSTFTLTLPARPIKEETWASVENTADSVPAEKPERRALGSVKRTILVVEDNEIAALQIRTALQESGYEVYVASGGADALEYMDKQVPDAVVLDLMMPGMDGFQVLERIRASSGTKTLPVLVLTAKDLTEEEKARLSYNRIQQLVQKGAVDRNQLVADVAKLLESSEGTESRKDELQPKEPRPSGAKQGAADAILVVEDDRDNLMAITAVLDSLGYEYITAGDGREGVRMAAENRPGLILMDIELPMLSGLDATGQIKSDPSMADIPIIAITARAMLSEKDKILEAGCNDYISKPLDTSELENMLKKWLG